MSSLLSFHGLSLTINGQPLFEKAAAQILPGARIGLIGPNGAGKSTLLKALAGSFEPSSGSIKKASNRITCYVPQLPEASHAFSGAEHFQKAFSTALASHPDLLLLDEPTNHLDTWRKKALINFLTRFPGTILFASHDESLLSALANTIWSIDHNSFQIYNGSYTAFCHDRHTREKAQVEKIAAIKRQTATLQTKLQVEAKRAAQSRHANTHENDRMLRRAMQEKGSRTVGRNQKKLNETKKTLEEARTDTLIIEKITPRFFFEGKKSGTTLSITCGSVAYHGQAPLIDNINLTLAPGERIALLGNNATGKSTLLKAMLGNITIKRNGHWHIPASIGYLDQHYQNLPAGKTVLESLTHAAPHLKGNALREHLARFLFRKPEEVNKNTLHLSGGEKARLSLALLSAKAPSLLLLDEVTNNLDLRTHAHILQTLITYTGTLIVISHDTDFLKYLKLDAYYQVTAQGLICLPSLTL